MMREHSERLPTGFYIEAQTCWEGTGNGDDTRCWALYQFKPVTVGHLWWKRQQYRWVCVRKAGEWHSYPDQYAYKSLVRWAWEEAEAMRLTQVK